jgi:hypothetical protein
MANPTDQAVAQLEREWGEWQIWVVHRYIGGPVYCARRWDGEGSVLNAVSPQDLAEQLAQAKADAAPPPPTVQEMRAIFFPDDPEGKQL